MPSTWLAFSLGTDSSARETVIASPLVDAFADTHRLIASRTSCNGKPKGDLPKLINGSAPHPSLFFRRAEAKLGWRLSTPQRSTRHKFFTSHILRKSWSWRNRNLTPFLVRRK